MNIQKPRLKDAKHRLTQELYALNDLPRALVVSIAGYLVYLLHTGRKDITGNDWADAFAHAIDGKHLVSPIGIADVVAGRQAWSLKTVKNTSPEITKQ